MKMTRETCFREFERESELTKRSANLISTIEDLGCVFDLSIKVKHEERSTNKITKCICINQNRMPRILVTKIYIHLRHFRS